MSELKPLPCPFCGDTPKLCGSDNHKLLIGWFVVCDGCGASQKIIGENDSGAAAIEAWNRRAQPAQAGQGTKVKEPHFAPQEAITEDGWTEWVCPKPKGYLAQCCDCGLVHEIDTRVAKYEPRPSENFEVVTDPDLQVQWRVRRRDDLRQEIREIPAFEPDQTPDLEAGKSRFYSAQAGQVLTHRDVLEEWTNTTLEPCTHQEAFVRGARWAEQAVLAKRVPMTEAQMLAAFAVAHPQDHTDMQDGSPANAVERIGARNVYRRFERGVRAAELYHGIVGEKGGE